MKKTAILVAALTLSVGAQASCYTVLGPKGEILSESRTPPVDMSYQLHQTVPYLYGEGASMVFGIADANCGEEVDLYYDLKPQRVVYEDEPRQIAPRKRHRRGARHGHDRG